MLYLYGKLSEEREGIWDGWGKAPYKAIGPEIIKNFMNNEEPDDHIGD